MREKRKSAAADVATSSLSDGALANSPPESDVNSLTLRRSLKRRSLAADLVKWFRNDDFSEFMVYPHESEVTTIAATYRKLSRTQRADTRRAVGDALALLAGSGKRGPKVGDFEAIRRLAVLACAVGATEAIEPAIRIVRSAAGKENARQPFSLSSTMIGVLATFEQSSHIEQAIERVYREDEVFTHYPGNLLVAVSKHAGKGFSRHLERFLDYVEDKQGEHDALEGSYVQDALIETARAVGWSNWFGQLAELSHLTMVASEREKQYVDLFLSYVGGVKTTQLLRRAGPYERAKFLDTGISQSVLQIWFDTLQDEDRGQLLFWLLKPSYAPIAAVRQRSADFALVGRNWLIRVPNPVTRRMSQSFPAEPVSGWLTYLNDMDRLREVRPEFGNPPMPLGIESTRATWLAEVERLSVG